MATDISDLQSKINVLKFQLSVMGLGSNSQEGEAIKNQISELQRTLLLEKMKQGSPS